MNSEQVAALLADAKKVAATDLYPARCRTLIADLATALIEAERREMLRAADTLALVQAQKDGTYKVGRNGYSNLLDAFESAIRQAAAELGAK